MKRYIFTVFLILSLAFFTGQGFAQPPEDFGKPPSKEHMEMIRKRIEALKIWRLTKALDLNEERASRLFPLINEYDKKRLAVERNMRKDMRKLRKSVDVASEDELRALIKRVEGSHKKLQKINDEEMKRLGEILTARELAKFIIFKQDFDREIKNIIAEVKKKRGRKLRNRDMVFPPEGP